MGEMGGGGRNSNNPDQNVRYGKKWGAAYGRNGWGWATLKRTRSKCEIWEKSGVRHMGELVGGGRRTNTLSSKAAEANISGRWRLHERGRLWRLRKGGVKVAEGIVRRVPSGRVRSGVAVARAPEGSEALSGVAVARAPEGSKALIGASASKAAEGIVGWSEKKRIER